MQLANLHQPCNHSTLLGTVRGAADYFGLDVSTPMLYGLSGHAFMLNIHRELCPSGPYCWAREPFVELLRNVGVDTADLGFWWAEGGASSRADVEAKLRGALDAGLPCSLLNLEWQLITGYDDTGLLTAQPWAPHCDFPPKHLTWGTWDELGTEVHLSFQILRPLEPVDRRIAVMASLAYARDLWDNPTQHTGEAYGVGPDGYANWLAAVAAGSGGSHGNWWNGTVWAECREQAAAYLRELAATYDLPVAAEVAGRYARVAELLKLVSDKTAGAEAQTAWLTEAEAVERAGVDGLGAVVEALGG